MALLSRDKMQEICQSLRGENKSVVFTNGCFDLLHRGHVELLQQARKLGDCLVVGLNSDHSVERLKGVGRPLQSAENRALILDALTAVDYVTIFDEETPLDLIMALKPDTLVKGADYDQEDIVGSEEVHSWGGKVVRIPLVKGEATRDIIRRAAALGQVKK